MESRWGGHGVFSFVSLGGRPPAHLLTRSEGLCTVRGWQTSVMHDRANLRMGNRTQSPRTQSVRINRIRKSQNARTDVLRLFLTDPGGRRVHISRIVTAARLSLFPTISSLKESKRLSVRHLPPSPPSVISVLRCRSPRPRSSATALGSN